MKIRDLGKLCCTDVKGMENQRKEVVAQGRIDEKVSHKRLELNFTGFKGEE